MAAKRCSICGTNWPLSKLYDDCPRCETGTAWASADPDYSHDEAREERKRIERERKFEEFEQRYREEWDTPEARKNRGDNFVEYELGDGRKVRFRQFVEDPDEVGRREARRLIENKDLFKEGDDSA